MPPRHIRKAFTLLELTIAMAIFSMLLVSLLESWSSMSRYASFAQVQDDLTIEGKRIVQDLKFDLSQSGWYLPDGTTASYADDRNVRYYPYIQVQNPDGFATPTTYGSKFRAHWRTLANVSLSTPENLPGTPADFNDETLTDSQYASSHYARSQEIIFLRVQSRAWNAQPSAESLQAVSFDGDYSVPNNHDALGIRRMSDYQVGNLVDAAGRHYVLRSGVNIYDLNPSCMWMRVFNTEATVPVLWEAMTSPPKLLAATATAAQAMDPDDLREYSYCVVPSPTNDGHGQLVRAYQKTAAAAGDRVLGSYSSGGVTKVVVVERVISDYVDRITFDTFRTDRLDALSINQVRVRIFLSRSTQAGVLAQSRIVEAVLALRTTTDFDTTTALATALGAAGEEPLLE